VVDDIDTAVDELTADGAARTPRQIRPASKTKAVSCAAKLLTKVRILLGSKDLAGNILSVIED